MNDNGDSSSSSSSSSSNNDKHEEKNVFVSCLPANHTQSNNSSRKSTTKLNSISVNPVISHLHHNTHQYLQQRQQEQQQKQQRQPKQERQYPFHDMTALTQRHMSRASQLSNGGGTVASLISKCKLQKLSYAIYDYSSQSGSYSPHNICENNPTQQSSRWSSGSHDHEQFITIQFEKPVIARSITFGKFYKGHVCNLKEFKVLGGLDPNEDLIELLHNGLKNDTEPETFPLKHQSKDLIFPVRYIKIVPLAAFSANFNYSIWYVEVRGIIEESIMQRVCQEYEQYKEAETTRLCLKYFRQKNMMDVFYILKNRTGIELEDPFVSNLHRYLVMEADFESAEDVLRQAAHHQNIYQTYTDNSKYTPTWKQIMGTSIDGELPSARGGHQMCIDTQDRKIYILGGWDGHQDLSDFWCYDMKRETWELISSDTQLQGGPSPRSCHKVCFDSISKSIFLLGRYVEPEESQGKTLESEFYRYYIEFNQWVKLSENTADEGGPELIFDHQMCVDSQGQTIYVFGGRTVSGDMNIQSYSGLYSYHITTNKWSLIRNDKLNTASSDCLSYGVPPPLKSRVGHSMLFDETRRSLYVFAGQRVRDYLSDLYRYDVDNDIVTEIAQDASKDAGPDAGFTQRATMDETLEELYVFSGYLKNTIGDGVKDTFWVYSIKKNEWQKVYQNKKTAADNNEPCPRFAHQMVYDPLTRVQYIFGGNPGDRRDLTKRLNDFWELRLIKPDPSAILRKCIFKIRLQKLKELCSRACDSHRAVDENSDILVALDYLRSQVAPVVDHDDEVESKEFHQICANLCLLQTMIGEEMDTSDSVLFKIVKSEDVLYTERTRLFESLLEYIPQEMKEPSGKLTDAVRLS